MRLESLLRHIYWMNHAEWKWLEPEKDRLIPICRYHFKLLPDQEVALFDIGYVERGEKGQIVLSTFGEEQLERESI